MIKTANENLFDAMVSHQIYLMRYSGYVRNRINSILAEVEKDVAAKIRARLGKAATGLTTPQAWARLESLLAAIGALRMEAWDEAKRFLVTEMVELSYYEPIQLNNSVKTVVPVLVDTIMPTPALLRSIALSRPFEGRVLKDWTNTMAAEDLRRIRSAIQMGMIAGEDTAAITRRVLGSQSLNYTDGALEMTRRQVQSVVRTAVNHIGTQARAEWYSENADVLLAEQFVATLDNRTTPVCRARDGQIYEIGKGPVPPLHWSCRSLRIPVLDGQVLSARPAKPVTQSMLLDEFTEKHGLGRVTSRGALPRGTKGAFDDFSRRRLRELVGQVSGTETYQTWLTKQSVRFQDEVLGKTKAQLFRQGGLKLDQFVNRAGDELTLKQLAELHANAFRAAGLNPMDF